MALLDNNQLASLHPFFATGTGRFAAKVIKKVFSLDDFVYYYETSGADGSVGPDFAYNVCLNTKVNYQVAGLENLMAIKEGPFIVVSNHPYGGLDGIILVDLFGHTRPGFKIIVNKFISILEYMAPSFINVTPTGKEKKAASAVSIQGIKQALDQVKSGLPLGVFPAGATSNLKFGTGKVFDRPWQEAIIKVIRKANVPVIPVHFLDRNTNWFYGLGYISNALRTMRLPKEVINKGGKQVRLVIGEPVSVEEQKACPDIHSLSDFLRSKVYDMPVPEKFTFRNDFTL